MNAPITAGGHTRIRPFNTRDTYPEQNLDNDLCQAVVAGEVVYLRGQIGQDLDTSESVGIGDVDAQAEKAMANIDDAPRRGRQLGWSDIVKVTIYLVDIRYRETVYRMMGRWLKGVHPVSTGAGRLRPRPPGVAGRDRRHRGHPGGTRDDVLVLGTRRDRARSAWWSARRAPPSPRAACTCGPGVGAVASQNVTNPRAGHGVLDSLGRQSDADAALCDGAWRSRAASDYRQLTVVDARGATPRSLRSARRSGCTPHGRGTPDGRSGQHARHDRGRRRRLLDGFAELGGRSRNALLDGSASPALDAGGEAGPVHSAGLVVVEDVPWPVTDLRVDWPTIRSAIWSTSGGCGSRRRTTIGSAASTRPRAPSYGVPGDL